MPGVIEGVWNKLLALFGKGKTEDPGDPYAMVGAPQEARAAVAPFLRCRGARTLKATQRAATVRER